MSTTGQEGMRLRAAGPDEDAAVRAVIAGAFPDNPKTRAEITRWQYWDNPFGTTRSWVWEDADGSLVAHYAAYPVPVTLGGRRTAAGTGVDAAVLPSHQGRRLFVPLSRALYADAAAHGMPVTICYPNANSTAGITKAGWVPVARLRTLVTAYDDAWLADRFRLPRAAARALRAGAFRVPGSPLAAQEVAGVPDGLDDLWAQVAPTVSHGVVRDAAWWRWRYAAHPDAPYRFFEVRESGRLVGAAATLSREAFGGTFLTVLELLTTTPTAARALARALVAAAGDEAGAALVAVPGSDLDRLAVRAGFRRLPQRLEPKPLMFGVVPADGSVADPAGVPWSVAWGDLDHL